MKLFAVFHLHSKEGSIKSLAQAAYLLSAKRSEKFTEVCYDQESRS